MDMLNEVPGLGIVKFTRHAKERMAEQGIREQTIKTVLFEPGLPDVRDTPRVIFRQKGQIRIVLIRGHGQKINYIIKTVYLLDDKKRNKRATRVYY